MLRTKDDNAWLEDLGYPPLKWEMEIDAPLFVMQFHHRKSAAYQFANSNLIRNAVGFYI